MFLGILDSSTPLLSIALHFIARSLPSKEGPGGIDQNPLKMLERPTFTMRDSYENRDQIHFLDHQVVANVPRN